MLDLSTLCRLCGCDLSYGVDIFLKNDEGISLAILINKYLPIQVIEDHFLPRKICETCHTNAATTIAFIDLIRQGQVNLRNSVSELKSIQKENEIHLQVDTDVTYDMDKYITDLDVEKQDTNTILNTADSSSLLASNEGVIRIDQDLSNLLVNNLTKGTNAESIHKLHQKSINIHAKKGSLSTHAKKGRPRKMEREITSCDLTQERPKRRICAPSRYKDSIAGREFEELLDDKDDSITLESFEDGTSQLDTLLDGSTVIVTQNHQEHSKIPAEVNIELNFKQNNLSNCHQESDCGTPTASVSNVKIVVPLKTNKNKLAEMYGRKNNYRKWVCDVCNKRFKFKGYYLIHLRTHESFTFQCEECKEQFAYKQQLNTHQDSLGHQGVGVIEEKKEVKCNLCVDLVFKTNEALEKHRSEIHNIKKRQSQSKRPRSNKIAESSNTYCCKMCGRIFLTKENLKVHQERAHSDIPRFVCSLCNKSFGHRQLLKQHRAVTHSDERPYSCDVCSFKFKTKVSLVSHKITHSSVKRYTCEICGKVLNYLTSLSHHLRSHHGDKPHTCSYCNKSFTQKGNLLEHTRIHTGEKPFSCNVCSKAFKTSSQAKHHTKQHFRTIFKCHVCEKTFKKEETLTKHIECHSDAKELDVVPASTIDECLNNVPLPLDNLLIPGVIPITDDITKTIGIPDQTAAFAIPECLSFDANPQDSSVIYVISKKDYQQLQFNNIEDEVFVENRMDTSADAFNLY